MPIGAVSSIRHLNLTCLHVHVYACSCVFTFALCVCAGLKPIAPEGGFFIIADTSDVSLPPTYLAETTPASGPIMRRDWAMARFLTKEIGVACIPPSAFFEEKDKELAKNIIRFAFCKEDVSLIEACKRLEGLHKYVTPTHTAVEAGAGTSATTTAAEKA